MNREGAETFLRRLAEAELRAAVGAGLGEPASRPLFSPDNPGLPRTARVARALIAVRAVDAETARDILDDYAVALSARQHSDPGPLLVTRQGWIGGRAYARPFHGPGVAGVLSGAGVAAIHGEAALGGAEAAGRTGPELFLPVGVTAPFRHAGLSGELNLLSYAHTGSGARFTVTWRTHDPTDPWRFGHSAQDPVFPQLFRVTDDRGTRYRLEFRFTGGPEWAGELKLHPGPPEHARWLEFSAPGEPAVRVSLDPAGDQGAEEGAGATDGQDGRSAGEQLLNCIGDRLLIIAAEYPQDLRLRLVATARGQLAAASVGLGDVVAALEAAEVLSPLSEVPGQLAELCESLRISGHGLATPLVAGLPERWLSVLAHYHRRKPHTAPPRDGYAAVAAAFPALDGVRLALLGLYNTGGDTMAHLLVSGLEEDEICWPGPEHAPISVWLRDSGGRWHVGGLLSSHYSDGEYLLRLKLIPPLARSTAWIDMQAAWRSAEVRAAVPLRWGYPP